MNRRRKEISLGILVILALTILAYLAVQTGHLKGIGQTVRVQVVFPNASGLVEDASVKVAGVKVGRVDHLEVDFDKARATLLIDKAAHIRKDALVTIRARSLLGEKYVEIRPQSRTAPLARNGDTLKAGPIGLDMDELVGALGPLLQGVDTKKLNALLDQINALIANNQEGLGRAVRLVNQVLDRVERLHFDDPVATRDVAALIHNLRLASDALPDAVRNADRTLSDLATDARPAIRNFDTAIAETRPALAKLEDLSNRATSTLEAIDRLAALLEPILKRLSTADYASLQKMLREEGVLIRLKPLRVRDATPPPTPPVKPVSGQSGSHRE